MPVHTNLMDDDVKEARRMDYALEYRDPPAHRARMYLNVPCEYCGEYFSCSEDVDIPLCDRCETMWGPDC